MAHHLKSEKDVQSHVKKLKNFYGELSVFVLAGYFWPLWIALIWGVILLLKASKLGIIAPNLYEGAHQLREKLPFIRPQWEGEKAQEIMKKMGKNVSDILEEELKSTKTKSKAVVKKGKVAKKKVTKTVKAPKKKK